MERHLPDFSSEYFLSDDPVDPNGGVVVDDCEPLDGPMDVLDPPEAGEAVGPVGPDVAATGAPGCPPRGGENIWNISGQCYKYDYGTIGETCS